ncbi:uncharacterized protein METZ01_LOCUS370962, partial [marine metagenome]
NAWFGTNNADSGRIVLDSGLHTVDGTWTLEGGIGYTVSSASAVVLTAMTLAGDLDVTTTGGTVTDTGVLSVEGLTEISASGFDVTLDGDGTTYNNFQDEVRIIGANVVIKDTNAIKLGASTVSGTYAVTVLDGHVTDHGPLIINEIATILASTTSSQDITLNENNNFKSGIRLEGRNVEVRVASAASLILGASSGMSTITGWLKGQGMGNPVTDGGALSVKGTTRITATGQNVTFDHPSSNLQGPLKILGANVSVTHPYAIELGDSTITGTYAVQTTTGNITDSESHGTLDVASNATFTTDASD